MKKLFSLGLTLTTVMLSLITLSLPVSAETGTYGDLTYEVSDGRITITDCDETTGDSLTIPIKLHGYHITEIDANAFRYCTGLTSITIPNSVTSIGSYAFWGCTGLKSIKIPNSVSSIGVGAFSDCSNLESITVDLKNTRYQAVDGNLYNKSGMLLIQYAKGKPDKSFSIPNSVTRIGDYAFYNCNNLVSINIPDSVIRIGDSALEGCTDLTSVIISDSVTTIGDCAFKDCTDLTSITILSPSTKIFDSSHTISDTATIYGYVGSTAEAYASKYGRTFVHLCEYESNWSSTETKHWHTCPVCGKIADEAAHVYDNGKVMKEPTTSDEGEHTFACTVCGYTRTEAIDKLPPATEAFEPSDKSNESDGSDGFFIWTILLIGIDAGAVIAIATIVVLNKKKK